MSQQPTHDPALVDDAAAAIKAVANLFLNLGDKAPTEIETIIRNAAANAEAVIPGYIPIAAGLIETASKAIAVVPQTVGDIDRGIRRVATGQ